MALPPLVPRFNPDEWDSVPAMPLDEPIWLRKGWGGLPIISTPRHSLLARFVLGDSRYSKADLPILRGLGISAD